jgi:hypothetical protein
MDELHMYVEAPCDQELENVRGLVMLHGLVEKRMGLHLMWRYERVLAVGWNSLVDMVVDVPWFLFPVSPCVFTHLDSPGIFSRPVCSLEGAVPHRLLTTCSKCLCNKRTCQPAEGMRCLGGCGPLECEPGRHELAARINACYNLATSTFFALSPPYQHLLMCTKSTRNYNGGYKMGREQRLRLSALVESSYLGGDEKIERLILEGVDAYQRVVFQHGHMTELVNHGVEAFGFPLPPYRTKKQAASCCTPDLGMADCGSALGMIDNALRSPGVIHWREECIFGRFATARVFIAATIADIETVYMTIGFKWQ